MHVFQFMWRVSVLEDGDVVIYPPRVWGAGVVSPVAYGEDDIVLCSMSLFPRFMQEHPSVIIDNGSTLTVKVKC